MISRRYILSKQKLLALALFILLFNGIIFIGQRSVSADAINATDFVTTWKTDNAGASNSTSITIPTSGAGYNYSVDWNNDGVVDQDGSVNGTIIDPSGPALTAYIFTPGAPNTGLPKNEDLGTIMRTILMVVILLISVNVLRISIRS